MIRDVRTTFADAVSLNTGAAGTYSIGDVIDLGVAGRDIGAGVPPLFLVLRVDTTATSGGSATLVVNLVTSANSDLSSGTTVATTGTAIPVATLTANYMIAIIPLPAAVYARYLGIQQVTGTAAFTAGKIDAFLVEDALVQRYYPDAI